MEGGREGCREGGMEGGKEGGMEAGWDEGREGGKDILCDGVEWVHYKEPERSRVISSEE